MRVRRFVAALGLAAVVSTAIQPGAAYADVTCTYRSDTHISAHGGLKADSAYHVMHGELPTCDQEKESDRDNEKKKDRDKKSRFCRKRWFC